MACHRDVARVASRPGGRQAVRPPGDTRGRQRLRSVRHRRRFRRCAGGTDVRRVRGPCRDRGDVPPGRNLRDPGLRTEETSGLCRPLSRGLRGRARLWLERAAGVLVADADREQEPGDRAARGLLPDAPQDLGCPAARRSRTVHRRAHRRCRRPAVSSQAHSHRDRRLADDARDPGNRALHQLERGAGAAGSCRAASSSSAADTSRRSSPESSTGSARP